MKHVVTQYKVKPDHAEKNAELIQAVFDELNRTRPDDLRYVALRLADGVTFIHITEEPEDGPSPFSALESAEHFRAGIAERFAGPPTVEESSVVGSFRFFAPSGPTPEAKL